MKVIAINGSPRKQWNTVQILSAMLDEAKKQGAETELIYLDNLRLPGVKAVLHVNGLEVSVLADVHCMTT